MHCVNQEKNEKKPQTQATISLSLACRSEGYEEACQSIEPQGEGPNSTSALEALPYTDGDSSAGDSPESSSSSTSFSDYEFNPDGTWNPYKRYPELRYQKTRGNGETKDNVEYERVFMHFTREVEKYVMKDKVGNPFKEEMRSSVPYFTFNEERDRDYFIGYDEEGNEVRYTDEQHYLRNIRETKIQEYEADVRRSMKELYEYAKRQRKEKRRQGTGKRIKKKTISYVGRRIGLSPKEVSTDMSKETKGRSKSPGFHSGSDCDGEKSGQDNVPANNEITKEMLNLSMNAVKSKQSEWEVESLKFLNDMKGATNDISLISDTRDRNTHSTENRKVGTELFFRETTKFDCKYLSDIEEKKTVDGELKANRYDTYTNSKDDGKEAKETCVIPGFEEEDKFSEDNDGNSDTDSLMDLLDRPVSLPSPATPSSKDSTTTMLESIDIDDEDEADEMERKQLEKSQREKEVDTIRRELIFRHSSRYKKEKQEKKRRTKTQKAMQDLENFDRTIEFLLKDMENIYSGDEQEEEDRSME